MSVIGIQTALATYTIDVTPNNITPDQEVSVKLSEIPQDATINMTIEAKVKTTPEEQSDFTIDNFLFPYESGESVFQATMINLVPGTPATVSILREDGTEATRTGNVTENGEFNASIQRELNRGMYNVSFSGTPSKDLIETLIDFGGSTKVIKGDAKGVATTESKFTPAGFNEGTVQVKVFVNNELQKEQMIEVSST